MKSVIIELITAATGSLGFAILFRVRSRLLLPATLGGFICWGVYLLGTHFCTGIFVPTLLTAAICALYAEISARIFKTPATVFFIPALIPLIPGSTLYYAMSYGVQKFWQAAAQYGYLTAQYALGIAAGASLVWAASDIIKAVSTHFRRKTNRQIP